MRLSPYLLQITQNILALNLGSQHGLQAVSICEETVWWRNTSLVWPLGSSGWDRPRHFSLLESASATSSTLTPQLVSY